MIRSLFLLRARFWSGILKVLALLFVGSMILVQVPELLYDLGPKTPVSISGPDELSSSKFTRATFVSIKGTPDFEKAFVYKRYGLSYTYFNIKPYGMRIVVRTYLPVTDDWKKLNRFLGKLRPFKHQPFHYRIRDIYREKFDIPVEKNAFFLALDDVPHLSGWQAGAFIFATLLWIVIFYMFYFYKKGGASP